MAKGTKSRSHNDDEPINGSETSTSASTDKMVDAKVRDTNIKVNDISDAIDSIDEVSSTLTDLTNDLEETSDDAAIAEAIDVLEECIGDLVATRDFLQLTKRSDSEDDDNGD